MIVSREPREHAAVVVTVATGAGSKIVKKSGYLDGIIIDAPASETYKFTVTGPAGKQYYISPSNLTGDVTVLFNPSIPMTGNMTLGISGSSGDGAFSLIPIGDLKAV